MARRRTSRIFFSNFCLRACSSCCAASKSAAGLAAWLPPSSRFRPPWRASSLCSLLLSAFMNTSWLLALRYSSRLEGDINVSRACHPQNPSPPEFAHFAPTHEENNRVERTNRRKPAGGHHPWNGRHNSELVEVGMIASPYLEQLRHQHGVRLHLLGADFALKRTLHERLHCVLRYGHTNRSARLPVVRPRPACAGEFRVTWSPPKESHHELSMTNVNSNEPYRNAERGPHQLLLCSSDICHRVPHDGTSDLHARVLLRALLCGAHVVAPVLVQQLLVRLPCGAHSCRGRYECLGIGVWSVPHSHTRGRSMRWAMLLFGWMGWVMSGD